MAAATDQIANIGRIAVFGDIAGIHVIVSAVATVYASASGGLPIDLAPVLNNSGIFELPYVRPEDVTIFNIPKNPTATGYIVGGLTLGTPTYGTPVWPYGPPNSTSVRENNSLATFPAWIRLVAIGASSANHAVFGEAADGAVTDTIEFIIVIARGGANIN